jgi:hypothetical protein
MPLLSDTEFAELKDISFTLEEQYGWYLDGSDDEEDWHKAKIRAIAKLEESKRRELLANLTYPIQEAFEKKEDDKDAL